MYSFFYYVIADVEAFKGAFISLDLEKLELFGEDYFFEHIDYMHKEDIYKNYIADTLMCISENTANVVKGRYMKRSYAEMIHPQPIEEQPEKPEDVIEIVNKKCGLIMIDDEEVG